MSELRRRTRAAHPSAERASAIDHCRIDLLGIKGRLRRPADCGRPWRAVLAGRSELLKDSHQENRGLGSGVGIDTRYVAVCHLLSEFPAGRNEGAKLAMRPSGCACPEIQIEPGLRVGGLGRYLLGWNEVRVSDEPPGTDQDLAAPSADVLNVVEGIGAGELRHEASKPPFKGIPSDVGGVHPGPRLEFRRRGSRGWF